MLVEIKKNSFRKDQFTVFVSALSNFQASEVFTGSLDHAKLVAQGFLQAGYAPHGDILNPNHYVVVNDFSGIPQRLYGPFTYEKAEEVLIETLKKGNYYAGPMEVTEEMIQQIKDDGYFNLPGGGVFIFQPDDFNPNEPVRQIREIPENV